MCEFQDVEQNRSLILELTLPEKTTESFLEKGSQIVCSANCSLLTNECENKSVIVELDESRKPRPHSMINLYLTLGQEDSAKCLGPMDHFEPGKEPDLRIVKGGNGTGKIEHFKG